MAQRSSSWKEGRRDLPLSNKLSTATDAPINEVLPLLRNDARLQTEIVEYEVLGPHDMVYWLRSKDGQPICVGYSPKSLVDEMETFITIDWDASTLQAHIVELLRQLPYECRAYDQEDEETVFRPDGALPPAPWTAP